MEAANRVEEVVKSEIVKKAIADAVDAMEQIEADKARKAEEERLRQEAEAERLRKEAEAKAKAEAEEEARRVEAERLRSRSKGKGRSSGKTAQSCRSSCIQTDSGRRKKKSGKGRSYIYPAGIYINSARTDINPAGTYINTTRTDINSARCNVNPAWQTYYYDARRWRKTFLC